MIKIAVDLMGTDKKINELVLGAIEAINENKDLFVYLCGDENEIKDAIKDLSYDYNQIEIVPTIGEVTNNDNPTRVFKEKSESSLIKAINLTKNDVTQGFVSCGSTGAVLVSSVMLLGKINDVRPGLAACLATANGNPVCLLDCGANVDCKVEHLKGFAYMGVAYMKALGIDNPRVALLSNGSEEKKGNDVVKIAHQEFKKMDINFVGNIEGVNALSGFADIIICDGFTGNVLLKSIEGTAKLMFNEIMNMAKSDEENSTIYKNIVKSLMKKYDYNSQGGATLLGIDKVVLKGHGAANSKTFYSIINQAYQLVKNDLIENTKKLLK